MAETYPPPAERRLLTLFLMMSAVMNLVDTTIANVALPHMQGTTSSSREEITWVLTSYIVASAMFTPLTGWLARRFGRKRLLLISIVGFTAVSALCGMARTLDELVLARLLQGVFGSSLVPMTQSTLLDINPPSQHGKAMAIFGLAAILGPLIGPLAGGWLTDNLSWRWVFYINLPFGLFSFLGLSATMPARPPDRTARLDFFGFGLLALALGSLQLMLDRGQKLDWLASGEIVFELTLCLLALAMFVIHSLTARRPFISPAIFADRNFVIATMIGFSLGVLIYSAMALMPPMLEALYGYSTTRVGLVLGPRALGSLIAMLLVGRLIGRLDSRLLVAAGLLLMALSMIQMAHLSLASDNRVILISGMIQGLGSSFIFVPLTTMAFATLSAHLRDEGSALNAMIRNMGASAGIAVVEALTFRNTETVHSRLAEGLRPDSPAMALRFGGFDWGSLSQVSGLEALLTRQAMMVSYIDSFWLLAVLGVVSAPFVFLLRKPRNAARGPAVVEH
ncbi:MAG: DHA2 family efflux MFS transporter permease subunit [Sphingomonadales bacterium]|nr:DHA2 family efflux MFS transporter permease subunit [Sphingomonadales bacterium]